MLIKYKITYSYCTFPDILQTMEVYALDLMSAVNAFKYDRSDRNFISIEEIEMTDCEKSS